ncbi:MAG TPA: tyrosine--tRNA ligase [Gemmatimonadaceae bacterium]|nr:tyrosine--tRNA ligase [Gemmatimonadaceae bacterium]
MTEAHSLLDELAWRGLLSQNTEGLDEAFAKGTVSAYCGFDPTASSMHVGNLIPVMGLMHLQRAGHRPFIVVGGGTGMIGDPSGKTAERQLNTPEVVAANTRALRGQLEKFLDFTGANAAQMRDNADWLAPLGAIDFMRDVGKHFTINYMMQKDSVQSRLESGMSYTEFSYMLLQAYDFRELFRRDGVTLQVGGSDQWGNITAGLELIRRTEGGDAHAMTFPLVTNSSGTKFGKTESGSVWLDPGKTSPYKFYQFWINIEDGDAGRYLRYFTLHSREEIESFERDVAERPQDRAAQQALAREVTTRVHGSEQAKVAEEVSKILFAKGDPSQLSSDALKALSEEVPFATMTTFTSVVDALVELKLAASKGAARRLVEQGGVSVNGAKVTDLATPVGEPLVGEYYLVKKGARDFGLIRTSGS